MDVPRELAELPQWCLWRNESGRKVPYQANGERAKSNDSSTWTTLYAAREAFAAGGYAGLGFVFAQGGGMVGVDLDSCLLDSGAAPWAEEILNRFDSYGEVSPSGRGVKLFVRGSLPGNRGRKKQMGQPDESGRAPGVELYASGRFFCFTGEHCHGPLAVQECQAAIDWLIETHWPKQEIIAFVPSHIAAPSDPDIERRALAYLRKLPPSVSGQGGHNACFRAACVLVLGFGLPVERSLSLIGEWNESCQPPWSERELLHKLGDADKCAGERGFLLSDRGRYTGPEADLRDILAQDVGGVDLSDETPEEREERTGAHVNSSFPDNYGWPPGFITDVMEYNKSGAMLWQPHLAFAGALALLATITGRKVQDSYGTRTNLYVLGLAPSGAGKERARKVNKSVLLHAHEKTRAMLGPEGFGSDSGLVSYMVKAGVALFQLDEIGRLLQTMQSPASSPHLFKVGSVLLKLYSSSDTIWTSDAYADLKKTHTINQPHCCVYGTAPPNQFWESLTEDNVSQGLLGRMLVFEGEHQKRTKRREFKTEKRPPDNLLNVARFWCDLPDGEPGNLCGETQFTPHVLRHTIEAEERLDSHLDAISERIENESPARAALWSRTGERTSKLALLFACSRAAAHEPLPSIELQDVERAIAISNWGTRRMLAKVFEHVSANQYEARNKKVLRLLDRPMSRSALTRKTQWLRDAREREEVLRSLEDAGLIERATRKTGGRDETVWRRRKH